MLSSGFQGRVEAETQLEKTAADHPPCGGRRPGRKSPRARASGCTIAGIGNVYSDEILFQAGLRPDRAVAEINRKTLEVLHRHMRRVLVRAIQPRHQK